MPVCAAPGAAASQAVRNKGARSRMSFMVCRLSVGDGDPFDLEVSVWNLRDGDAFHFDRNSSRRGRWRRRVAVAGRRSNRGSDQAACRVNEREFKGDGAAWRTRKFDARMLKRVGDSAALARSTGVKFGGNGFAVVSWMSSSALDAPG